MTPGFFPNHTGYTESCDNPHCLQSNTRIALGRDMLNPFMPTVQTFAVRRETDVSRTANVGTVGKNGLTPEA